MAQDWTPIYLAHRQTYAAFLTATDAEARVSWHRWRGDYPSKETALAETDAAYTRTQGEFNMIDLEGLGPVAEARALVDCIRGMHGADVEPAGIWAEFSRLREVFVVAARDHLGAHL
ncbi:hypothetical protein DSC45_01345 [Streptomyces sp. YIM 130001]|uniref:hypothetical protein n=1 Tax=Streptomyces sp. YIM 130001 TaxID=2259644 RepID=UPI000ED29E95|nr:hypothetical protein [Streptomyces sp. YIM 130001]RII21035.1 hypothetical protein DSC45_01345 [Streptomyces sp. YIM 130001]